MLVTQQPVLRRFWNPAMPVTMVDAGPQAFTLLGERLVLWRDGLGTYAAMEDRCCHRSAPLSKGWIDGNTLVCGYHGWSYDTAGACVRIPQRRRREWLSLISRSSSRLVSPRMWIAP